MTLKEKLRLLLDEYGKRYYCVIANGDSMSPEIDDGDEVICDPQAEIINGDMVHSQ